MVKPRLLFNRCEVWFKGNNICLNLQGLGGLGKGGKYNWLTMQISINKFTNSCTQWSICKYFYFIYF